MKQENKDTLYSCLSELTKAGSNQAVCLLQKIEKLGKDQPGVALKLIPLLGHPDYLVRSRVFISLGRLRDATVTNKLIDYLESNPGEEWELRTLECLYYLKDQSAVLRLAAFLDHTSNPLLIRGIVWLLGYLGGKEALNLMIDFTISPRGRLIKSEVTLEAIALALKTIPHGTRYWQKIIQDKPIVARFFRYTIIPDADQPRFFVYPYPDYLLDQAAVRGIKTKIFKKLFFWYRES